jgi:hypothetical protein
MQYSRSVERVSSKPSDLVLPAPDSASAAAAMAPVLHFAGAPPLLLEELWKKSEAEACWRAWARR